MGSCGGTSVPFVLVARDVGPAMARHSGAISADLAKFGPHSLRPVMGIRGHMALPLPLISLSH